MKPLRPQRPKPALTPRDTSEFPSSADEWDLHVFNNADHFTVAVGRNPFNRTRADFKTYPEALRAAKMIQGIGVIPMVYAVTADGRDTMLVPKKWDFYLQLGGEKNG